ncbi:MAG: exodeoxyribonuclease VII small subunit [Anaerovoracaceae bacterium]
MSEKKMTFEEAFEKLQTTAKNLKAEDINLEDALKNFENGIEYHKQCTDILNKAKQKIETYEK